MTGPAEFDRHAVGYDTDLARGLVVTGESKDFFAAGRVAWLHELLQRRRLEPRTVLDFGCGIGSATPHLLAMPGIEAITGIDISEASIDQARSENAAPTATYMTTAAFTPQGSFDLAYCSGVFHHIPVDERAASAKLVFDALKPGGVFAFCENNPWNPGTRWVMSRIPFDRDAVMLWPGEARRLVEGAGLRILSIHYLFVFPHFLAALRRAERYFVRVPLGGQYMVLCEKADTERR